MSKRESNIVEIKLERVGKKFFQSPFNTRLKQIQGHKISVSPVWPLSNDQSTPEYQLISTFGKMYVGQSFTSCLKLSNISQNTTLQNFSVTCSLKYTGVKSSPILFQQDIPKVSSKAVYRFAFTTNVHQPDVYYLNFQVRFNLRQLPDPINFNKLFKFQAKMPLECSNMIFKGEVGYYVQCRLSNCTIYPMKLDKVNFMPGKNLQVINLHQGFFGDSFSTGEVRSYLYQLVECAEMPAQVELGNLVVSWFNNSGDAGTIASQTLTHVNKVDRILKVRILDRPDSFSLEIPIAVTFEFSNLSSNFYMEDVVVDLDSASMRNVVLTPLGGLDIGRIEPGRCKNLRFCLFPKRPGFHKVEGLSVRSGTKAWEYQSCKVYINL